MSNFKNDSQRKAVMANLNNGASDRQQSSSSINVIRNSKISIVSDEKLTGLQRELNYSDFTTQGKKGFDKFSKLNSAEMAKLMFKFRRTTGITDINRHKTMFYTFANNNISDKVKFSRKEIKEIENRTNNNNHTGNLLFIAKRLKSKTLHSLIDINNKNIGGMDSATSEKLSTLRKQLMTEMLVNTDQKTGTAIKRSL